MSLAKEVLAQGSDASFEDLEAAWKGAPTEIRVDFSFLLRAKHANASSGRAVAVLAFADAMAVNFPLAVNFARASLDGPPLVPK
eukprot:CAMPEP_0179281372 /NCGR_PEP_ID=MMETSP0797-20121207/37118_1 /TAXON_ID=47934 /ORGANISM="Dinophysis acuminata, Strain DAEP01" /LENGTH=83 /DNA_ID=CAMNT_0020990075 /DNA_START=87 /DNA_END=336 /DNA_ORIENTATION=+